jgi:hypothetical protein
MRLLIVLLLAAVIGCTAWPFGNPRLSGDQASDTVIAALGQFGTDVVRPAGLNSEWAGDATWRVTGRFRLETGKPEAEGMWLVNDHSGEVTSADGVARYVDDLAQKYNQSVTGLVCPEGYPVKANPETKRYLTPDAPGYGQTQTARVRCFPSTAEADAQGYRPTPRPD